jgi:hypothetical protein
MHKKYGVIRRNESGSRRIMLTLVRAKSCKRCGGDLSIECDIYGVFIECIQCGATYNKSDLTNTPANTENAVKAKPLASTPIK